MQVFLFSLGNSTSAIQSVLNRSVAFLCWQQLGWLAVSVGMAKSASDEGKQKPRTAGYDYKGWKNHPKQKLGDGQSVVAKGTVRWTIHAKDKTLSSCIGSSWDVQRHLVFTAGDKLSISWLQPSEKAYLLQSHLILWGQEQLLLRGDRNLDEMGCKRWSTAKRCCFANCLLPSNSAFLRASRTRMANVSLLLSLAACYLSWDLECFCHSEHSPVFLNTIHVNPFFTFLHCHQALEFMSDFILLGRTSWRSGGKEHVVNTKGIHQAWLLSSGSCP